MPSYSTYRGGSCGYSRTSSSSCCLKKWKLCLLILTLLISAATFIAVLLSCRGHHYPPPPTRRQNLGFSELDAGRAEPVNAPPDSEKMEQRESRSHGKKCSVVISASNSMLPLARALSSSVRQATGCDAEYMDKQKQTASNPSLCFYRKAEEGSRVKPHYSANELCTRLSTKVRGTQSYLFSSSGGDNLENLAQMCGTSTDKLKLTAFIEDADVMVNLLKGDEDVLGVFSRSWPTYRELVDAGLEEVLVEKRTCSVYEPPEFGDLTVRMHRMNYDQRQAAFQVIEQQTRALDEGSKPQQMLVTID